MSRLGPKLIWRNWVGNQIAHARHFNKPASEDELCAVIAEAAREGLSVRVAGGGHSVTPIVPTDGLLLSCERLAGVLEADPDRLRVTIAGGTRISDLGEPLRALGLALANQGDIDLQTMAGAAATATHGTGYDLPCMSASVRSLRIVDPRGEIVVVDRDAAPERLAAAQVSLGLFGVAASLTLDVVPAYDLHEILWRAEFESCMEQFDALARSNRHAMFFWCPNEHSASLYSVPDTTGFGSALRTRDFCEMRVMNVTREPPSSVAGKRAERIGPSFRMFPGGQPMPNHHECEYALPYDAAPAIMRALRSMILTRFPDFVFPVEYRPVAADGAWLSPFHDRRAVMISVAAPAAMGDACRPFFDAVESLFAEADGRPHWGKIHHLTRSRIAALYPRHADFVALRRTLDPHGVFLNLPLAEAFG